MNTGKTLIAQPMDSLPSTAQPEFFTQSQESGSAELCKPTSLAVLGQIGHRIPPMPDCTGRCSHFQDGKQEFIPTASTATMCRSRNRVDRNRLGADPPNRPDPSAAVDRGQLPNDFQFGNSRKIVAPHIEIVLGISAIKHL